jgi:hypothetical protein
VFSLILLYISHTDQLNAPHCICTIACYNSTFLLSITSLLIVFPLSRQCSSYSLSVCDCLLVYTTVYFCLSATVCLSIQQSISACRRLFACRYTSLFLPVCDCLLVFTPVYFFLSATVCLSIQQSISVCLHLSVVGQERSQLSHDFCVQEFGCARNTTQLTPSTYALAACMLMAQRAAILQTKVGSLFRRGQCILSLPLLGSIWLLPVISLHLTNTVSPVQACLSSNVKPTFFQDRLLSFSY